MNISALVKKHKLIFSMAGFLTALLLFTLGLQVLNYQKICHGIYVAGQNFSGLNEPAAQQKMETFIDQIKNQPIEFNYGNKKWLILPSDLGINFDAKLSIQNAYQACHDQNFLVSIFRQLQIVFSHRSLPLVYQLEPQKLNNFIQENLSSLESPAKNATLRYDPQIDDFIFMPAKPGKIFDRDDLESQFGRHLGFQQKSPIALKLITDKPTVTQDKDNAAKIKAEYVLALAPYQLKNASDTWSIEKQVVSDWLDFVPDKNFPQTISVSISLAAVSDFLAQLAPAINKPPVDATLSLKDGKVQTFALSQNGQELDITKSAQIISQEILSGEKEIDLQVEEKEPQITTETLDTLGLTELLGVGSSSFAGSPRNRIYNIGIGAGKINGLIVDPGQEFSVVQALGAIDASTGYLPELVIKENKTIPEYGGGLCQISTTLFRAAVNAGLKITERYPHAFPVHYYNPQGFDATIYPPHPDLRFINDTPNHILIQSKIKGNVITFEIYGTADGRQVKINGPIILESNKDGSMKTVLYQEIWRDGMLERKSTFSSNYKSPALYPVVKNPLE